MRQQYENLKMFYKHTPKFHKHKRSDILTDLMVSNLICELPEFVSFFDWRRLYKMDIDGKSYIKFFEVTRGYENTIIVVQDEFGFVFGAYTTESWKKSYKFYGNGAERLFTFRDADYPEIFTWGGEW